MSAFKTLYRDLESFPKLYPLAVWFLRIVVFVYIYINYDHRLLTFDFKSEYFYLSVFYFFFAFLLLISGFTRTSNLTRLSALMMLIVIFAHTVASTFIFKKIDEPFAAKLLFMAIVFMFTTFSKKFDYYRRFKDNPEDVEQEIINEYPPALRK